MDEIIIIEEEKILKTITKFALIITILFHALSITLIIKTFSFLLQSLIIEELLNIWITIICARVLKYGESAYYYHLEYCIWYPLISANFINFMIINPTQCLVTIHLWIMGILYLIIGGLIYLMFIFNYIKFIYNWNVKRRLIKFIRSMISDSYISIEITDPDWICSICYDNEYFNTICIKNCNHIFHKTCILEWFKTHSTCPLCRRSSFSIPQNFTHTEAIELSLSLTSSEQVR